MSTPTRPQRPQRRRARSYAAAPAGRGFTLTEMLVAVGAMALLALGVAEVFSLTTRTVSAGRRLSNLNAVASATERQLRADLSAMTGRGPMVIRNQLANNGQPVEAYPGDPAPRARRIDELLFFATGQFYSQQQPVTVDGQPVGGSAAMVYYGHGARQDLTAATASGLLIPVRIDDTNAAAPPLGVTPAPGGSKVNQYAGDWTLVRRAFVLTPPATQSPRVIPAGQGFPAGSTQDSAFEIAGLPAVASVNRFDAANWASVSTGNARLRAGKPALSSGVVDVVAMDLRAVAAQLVYAYWAPNNGGDPRSAEMIARANELPVGNPGQQVAAAQRAWMRALLPADSDSGRRIRVEPTAPDFLNLNGGAPNGVSRSDQLMLTSGAFLPRCSEFIVEYSFGRARISAAGNGWQAGPGQTADTSAVFWHGLARKNGAVLTGSVDYGRDTTRYEDWAAAAGGPIEQHFKRRDNARLPVAERGRLTTVKVQPGLIEPRNVDPWGGNGNWSLSASSSYAFFGLFDPTYAPNTTLLAKDSEASGPRNGRYDWADGDVLQEPETVPWMRPTMIRVTFTLTDATDPSIEQTFQFIFDLPRDGRSPEM